MRDRPAAPVAGGQLLPGASGSLPSVTGPPSPGAGCLPPGPGQPLESLSSLCLSGEAGPGGESEASSERQVSSQAAPPPETGSPVKWTRFSLGRFIRRGVRDRLGQQWGQGGAGTCLHQPWPGSLAVGPRASPSPSKAGSPPPLGVQLDRGTAC